MWALVKSPLILGNDITNMVSNARHSSSPALLDTTHQSDETKMIITNDAIIGANQDPSGPANRVWKRTVPEGGDLQLWSGSLSNKYALYEHAYPHLLTSPLSCLAYSCSRW